MKKTSLTLLALVLMVVLTLSIGFTSEVSAATVKQDIKITNTYMTVSGIKIKWSNSYTASGYEIYRSVNGGKYLKYDSAASKNYTDMDIETGEIYRYKIRSYKYVKNKRKYSSKSGESISIQAKPYGVSKVNVYSYAGYNFVSWKENPLASGYKIYRSTDKVNWEYLNTIYINLTNYEDDNIDNSADYTYKVTAVEIVDGKVYESAGTLSVEEKNNKGIDVSYHNGKINWKKVKNSGVSFAMIRLGYGTSKSGIVDSKLDYNYREAKKYGIKVGFYLYSYADNAKEAKNEAKFTVKLLKKYNDADYPIAFDFENAYRNKKKYKKANTKIITTYCDYLERRGYETCVYSYLDFLKKSVNYKKVSKYGIWLAKWTFRTDNFDNGGIPNVQMWQYSDKGKIKGISGVVDLNLEITQ